jgi:dTMP kinase
VEKQLRKSRAGADRAYLKNQKDIHESSTNLQINVEKEYLRLCNKYEDFTLINCISKDGTAMLSPEMIHLKIVSLIKQQKKRQAPS